MDYGSYVPNVGQDEEELLYQIATTPPPTVVATAVATTIMQPYMEAAISESEIETLNEDFKMILGNEMEDEQAKQQQLLEQQQVLTNFEEIRDGMRSPTTSESAPPFQFTAIATPTPTQTGTGAIPKTKRSNKKAAKNVSNFNNNSNSSSSSNRSRNKETVFTFDNLLTQTSDLEVSPPENFKSDTDINMGYENNLNYLNSDQNGTNHHHLNNGNNNNSTRSQQNVKISEEEKRYLMLDMRQRIEHHQNLHREQMIKLRATHIDFGSKRVSCDSLRPYSDATKTKKHLPNHVKRPMNAFMVWSQMERRKISVENPDKHNADISKSLGARWRELSEEDRHPYKIEAHTLQKFHEIENPNYKYKPKKSGKTTASKKKSPSFTIQKKSPKQQRRTKRLSSGTGTISSIDSSPIKPSTNDSLNYTQNSSSSLSEKQADNSCQQCPSLTGFEDLDNLHELGLNGFEYGNSFLSNPIDVHDYNSITPSVYFHSNDLNADINQNLMAINTNGQQDLPSFIDTTSQFKTETDNKYVAHFFVGPDMSFPHPESNNTVCDEDLAACRLINPCTQLHSNPIYDEPLLVNEQQLLELPQIQQIFANDLTNATNSIFSFN